MKAFLIALILISAVVIVSPTSASAATNAGIKPGNFWYGFDLAFEKINLFFAFNSEGKAKKALSYADERLAEAKSVAESDNTDAVKTAITNYESSIAFVAEKSKDVSDKEKAEALLTSIADNTSKHQEILADVLAKVPDEARETITRAIEASKKGWGEAMRQVAEFRGEVKNETEELKTLELKRSDDGNQTAEIEKLRKEIKELEKEVNSAVTPTISNDIQAKPHPQNSSVTLNETWEELEKRYFAQANKQGWATLIITNSFGEQRYYYYFPKTGVWSKAETEKEMGELAESIKIISDYEQSVADTKNYYEQLGQMAKLQSELERELYSSYSQIINQPSMSPPTYYETYEQLELPEYSSDITIKTPSAVSPIKWNVQWTGGGAGFIQNSSGRTTNFQCDSLLGRCFSL